MRKTITTTIAALAVVGSTIAPAAPAQAAKHYDFSRCSNATKSMWLVSYKTIVSKTHYRLHGLMSGWINDTTEGAIFSPRALWIGGVRIKDLGGTQSRVIKRGTKATVVARWDVYHYRPGAGKRPYTDILQCTSRVYV